MISERLLGNRRYDELHPADSCSRDWCLGRNRGILLNGPFHDGPSIEPPMRAEAIRAEVVRMVRQAPFRPFVLSMENGDRVTIGHPENIAFEPDGESFDFYVIASGVRLFETFDAVSSVAMADSVAHLA